MEEPRVLYWETPEYEHHAKTPDWYWALGLIVLVFFVIAILLNNILFAVLIVLSGISLAMYGVRKPGIVEVEVGIQGVIIGNTLHPYASLESFWVDINESGGVLYLKSEKTFAPLTTIPIKNVSPEKVRDILLDFIPEEEHHEPLPQKIMGYFGF